MECNTGFIFKICGITRHGDYDYILRQPEVNAVGFVAYPPSRRFVPFMNVKEIIDGNTGRKILKVGVFVDEEEDFIMDYAESGVEVAQLHSDEPPEFAEKLSRKIRVWKALRPQTTEDIDKFKDYPAESFLIDAFSPALKGGTGKLVDRKLVLHAISVLPSPVILSGGLTPENVADAITAVKPAGIDVSSGVELSPGIKDLIKIKDFIAAASPALA